MGDMKWPSYREEQHYVRDRIGVIWLLLPEYDGRMASTATATGITTVGINKLRNERGPLHILALTPNILDRFPTIEKDGDGLGAISGTVSGSD